MKTAICYYSRHHGNTRKVLEAMAREGDIDLIDVTARRAVQLEGYDCIGFASGVYALHLHKSVVAFARQYLDVPPEDSLTPAMVRAALGSVADTCIIPMQDYLGLGASARINTPGTLRDNWVWRLRPGTANRRLAAHIRMLTRMYGRT